MYNLLWSMDYISSCPTHIFHLYWTRPRKFNLNPVSSKGCWFVHRLLDQLLLSINEREKTSTSLDILIQASKLFRLKTSNDFFLDIMAPDVYFPHLIILCPTRSHPMCKNVFWKNNLSWKNSFWLQNYYRINFSVTGMTLLI